MAIIPNPPGSLSPAYPSGVTNLAAAINALGLTQAQCLTQVKAHFATTDANWIAAVRAQIYPALTLGISILGRTAAAAFDYFHTGGEIVGGDDLPTWLAQILDDTGANGDALTITRVDPATIATKNWL